MQHEVIWKLQIVVCNMRYLRSQLRAFLDMSVFIGLIKSNYFVIDVTKCPLVLIIVFNMKYPWLRAFLDMSLVPITGCAFNTPNWN